MRLAVVVEQLLAPVPGGAGRWARELAAALAATAAAGDQVAGWCAFHADTRPAGVPSVAGPARVALPAPALALAWERGLGPRVRGDVVLAPTVLVPPLRRGQRLVATVHDAVPWTHPETLTRRGVAFHRRCVARIVATASAILVDSVAVRDELSRHVALEPARVHLVPGAVSAAVAEVPADAAERARRLALPEGYLLALGTLEPRKGLDVAIAALAALHRDGAAPPPLLLAGPSGWGGLDPAAAAAHAGLPAGAVRSLGALPDADLAVTLSRATALVAPSRSEGFGLPALEAMAHGVPVVSSDTPALVELAAGASLTVPVGDAAALAAALRRVLTDQALRADLAERGRRRAGRFSWAASAAQVWRICHEIGPRQPAGPT